MCVRACACVRAYMYYISALNFVLRIVLVGMEGERRMRICIQQGSRHR